MKTLIIAALMISSAAFATPQCDRVEKYQSIKDSGRELLAETERFSVVVGDDENRYIQLTTATEVINYLLPFCRTSKLPSPHLGMTAKKVEEGTNWGKPVRINRSGNSSGIREQWVYGNGQYLYFKNGKLTGWQN
jgi:hypothetical protein